MVAVAGILLVAGCHKDPISSADVTVNNKKDNFHFQLNEASELDSTMVYYWQMEGTTANIDQYSSLRGGTALVVIEDHSRAQVYQTDLTQNGDFSTSYGATGIWMIRFTLSNFTGMIDFRAQRK